MLGNFISNYNIYGKGPQFYEIIQRRLHTPTCILSWVICVQYFLSSLNLSITIAAVDNIDMCICGPDGGGGGGGGYIAGLALAI